MVERFLFPFILLFIVGCMSTGAGERAIPSKGTTNTSFPLGNSRTTWEDVVPTPEPPLTAAERQAAQNEALVELNYCKSTQLTISDKCLCYRPLSADDLAVHSWFQTNCRVAPVEALQPIVEKEEEVEEPEKLPERLKKEEGYSDVCYRDTGGKLHAAGYGNLADTPEEIAECERQEHEAKLKKEIAERTAQVQAHFPDWDSYNQARKDAIIEISFWHGVNRFNPAEPAFYYREPVAMIKAGRWFDAGESFLKTPQCQRNDLIDRCMRVAERLGTGA